MTITIEEAAREIAISIVRDDASEAGIVAFARLLAEKAALAGILLGREQAAAESGSVELFDGNLQLKNSDPRLTIAQAIRALP